MAVPVDSDFDVIADLVHIEKDGVRLSQTLIETLATICHSKGVSVQVLIATVMWDYAGDYNNNMRKELMEYQAIKEYGRTTRFGRKRKNPPA